MDSYVDSLNEFIYLFILFYYFFLMRLFLFVSAAVVIVLLGQIFSQFYLPFSQKNYNSRQGISTKITCQGRCVASVWVDFGQRATQ